MHENFMAQAIQLARQGAEINEVPVGCVIVKDGQVIARAHNLRQNTKDATAHAEILAIRQACQMIGDWRLNECDMYVTLEPCPMCAGAIIAARIGRLFYGTDDPRGGCCGTLYNIPTDTRFNHRAEIVGGVLKDECSTILKDYFKQKRIEEK